jgi:RimJ/RimL family protein N-acetyltransferase
VITVRPATRDDAGRLLTWANDPATRSSGFHPAAIDPATHARWLEERLTSTQSRLFIGLEADQPIGQVRLEAESDGRVEVGISVAPDARARGVGHALLAAGLTAGMADPHLRPGVFVARIRPDNAASIALFTGAGFVPVGEDEVAGIRCLVYERPVY